MSAHFRSTLTISQGEAAQLLANPITFPVPMRLPSQTESDFKTQVQASLRSLGDQETDTLDLISQISDSSDRWMALRTHMTGNERTADTTVYDDFVATIPYPTMLNNLRKHQRALRDQRRQLEAAIFQTVPPSSTASASVIHLPKTELPRFSGNCVEYQSFWNSFKSCVHDLPLTDSIKFTYLKQCLLGMPLTLISPLPISDASYTSALDLLKRNYDNPEDVARSFHNSLRNLPPVRGGDAFCSDLRSLLDQLECICVQMSQQNQSYDHTSFQMEIEQRLPRFVLDEIFKAKEEDSNWSSNKLKERLRVILRRKEQIDSIQPKSSNSPNISPRATPFVSPRGKFSRNTPPAPLEPNPLPTLTFTTQGAKSGPRFPCLFCNDPSHSSPRCSQYANVKSRSDRIKSLNRCYKCMKAGHFAPPMPTTGNLFGLPRPSPQGPLS